MCGADDFLNKPVNKHELLARVHSLLRLKQFTDELDNAETVLFSPCPDYRGERSLYRRALRSPFEVFRCAGGKTGLPQDLRVALRRGGFIHDIGKLAVRVPEPSCFS